MIKMIKILLVLGLFLVPFSLAQEQGCTSFNVACDADLTPEKYLDDKGCEQWRCVTNGNVGENVNSGSGNEDSENLELSDDNSGKSSDDSNLDDDKLKTETRTTIIEDGREIEIRTKTEIKDGLTETEERRIFTDENGNEITIRTKSEIGKGISVSKTTYYLKVKGVEVKTKLSLRTRIVNDKTRIKVKLSTGAEKDLFILPDKALLTALEELKATDNFEFEIIEESIEGEGRKAVFTAKARKSGRILGIFRKQVELETFIDIETGEIIKTNKPWWAFSVLKSNKMNICHVTSEDKNERFTINIAISAVKSHLDHGDDAGDCLAICGDGIIVVGKDNVEIETCDDGNLIGGDGCSSSCLKERIDVVCILDTECSEGFSCWFKVPDESSEGIPGSKDNPGVCYNNEA